VVAHLDGVLPDDVADHVEQVPEAGRVAGADVEDVGGGVVDLDRSHHRVGDVVDVHVVTGGAQVTEDVQRLAGRGGVQPVADHALAGGDGLSRTVRVRHPQHDRPGRRGAAETEAASGSAVSTGATGEPSVRNDFLATVRLYRVCAG